jgi:drug/metabolite transporter (DMT)-like permease
MNTGVFAGILAGAFWGFSFLVPIFLGPVSPSEIALGRFLWFGFFSLLSLLLCGGFRKGAPVFRFAVLATKLSLAGFSLYYVLLVLAIQDAGIPISSLIIGQLPVVIALISRDQVHRPKQFVTGVASIVSGLLLLNVHAYVIDPNSHGPNLGRGIFLSFICMALWAYFAIRNSQFLRDEPKVDSLEWASVLGIYSALTMVILDVGIQGFSLDPANTARLPILNLKLIVSTAFLGIFPTFIASRLWNFASRRLPTGLLAQLIVSETLFALIYGFVYGRQLPGASEWISMILVVSGVMLAIRSYQNPSRSSSKV